MISKKTLKIIIIFQISHLTLNSIFDISLQDLLENPSNIKSKISGPDRTCIKGLVSSYGLQELSKPKKMVIEMCPGIKYSCCKEKAQIEIFQNWGISLEERKLEEKFNYFRRIYYKLLSSLLLADKRVRILKKKLTFEKEGNCKILSSRISSYKIEEIVPKLKTAIDNMYDFFFQSYEGFYCTICNAEQQVFIDVFKRKIKMDYEFCRQISENSLSVLLYFHSDFIGYFNLIAKFLKSCDYRGNFKNSNLSPDYQFRLNIENTEMLENCKANRSSNDWFRFCLPICKKFHPLKINNFFYPHLKKYSKFSDFIHKRLRIISTQEKDNAIIQKIKIITDPPKTKKNRVDELRVYKKHRGKWIIKSGSGLMILNDFEVEFSPDEKKEYINFFKNGGQSSLTESIYKTILLRKKKSTAKQISQIFSRILKLGKEDDMDFVRVWGGFFLGIFVLF